VNTFDRYLLREWLQILGLVLAATCGLMLLQVLYEDFRSLRDLGAQGATFWLYVGVTLPGFLMVVLPLALLVSLLYTLGTLHRGNEVTAMRAAGVGFTRLTAPIWVVGVLCCALAWWLNTTVVPWSVERSRALRDELQIARDAAVLPQDRVGASYSVAFDNREAGRMWFFNRYSRFTAGGAYPRGRGFGVSVSRLDGERRELSRITAAEGWLDPVKGGWEFRDGRDLVFEPETGELTVSRPFEEKFVPEFDENPQLMLLIDRKPSHLSLHELRELIAYLRIEDSPKVVQYEVRYYTLIANAFGPLIVIAIAIPFAVSGVRVNPAVGVSKSIGLFFVYYVLTHVGGTLATKDIVEPAVAAWFPHGGMGLLAVWLFARLR
jgi:lipopolysaccharide export system permease protein